MPPPNAPVTIEQRLRDAKLDLYSGRVGVDETLIASARKHANEFRALWARHDVKRRACVKTGLVCPGVCPNAVRGP
jgi:hypothetical protein